MSARCIIPIAIGAALVLGCADAGEGPLAPEGEPLFHHSPGHTQGGRGGGGGGGGEDPADPTCETVQVSGDFAASYDDAWEGPAPWGEPEDWMSYAGSGTLQLDGEDHPAHGNVYVTQQNRRQYRVEFDMILDDGSTLHLLRGNNQERNGVIGLDVGFAVSRFLNTGQFEDAQGSVRVTGSVQLPGTGESKAEWELSGSIEICSGE